ncbi:MAG: hypothetical protein IJD06_09055 [Clostridia bacterium]|nr:hypothetical protein [Clostridia bacterium]
MAKETTKIIKKSTLSTAERRKNTQTVVTRMLIMVAVDIIGICTLLSIRKDAVVELAFVNSWLLPLTIVFGVLTLAAAVYQVLALVKKINTSAHPVTPAMLLCIALFCLITCLVYKSALGATVIAASVIATILFLVYCLYMHIFYR